MICLHLSAMHHLAATPGLPDYFGAPPCVPFETQGHKEWRTKVRTFVRKYMTPENVTQWDEEQGFPRSLHNLAAAEVRSGAPSPCHAVSLVLSVRA
jgi:hypothetical protein